MHVPIDETMKAAVIACMYLLGYNEGCSGVNVTAIGVGSVGKGEKRHHHEQAAPPPTD